MLILFRGNHSVCALFNRETNTLLSSLSETPAEETQSSGGLVPPATEVSEPPQKTGSDRAAAATQAQAEAPQAPPQPATVIIEIAVPGRDCPIKLKVFRVCIFCLFFISPHLQLTCAWLTDGHILQMRDVPEQDHAQR